MDDISGIRLLAGLIDVIRDKEGSAALLNKLAAHETAATQALIEAQKETAKTASDKIVAAQDKATAQAHRDDIERRLIPREVEVRKGGEQVTAIRITLEQRAKDIEDREKELVRRENFIADRESKIIEDEKAIKIERDKVVQLREQLSTKIANLKKVAGE